MRASAPTGCAFLRRGLPPQEMKDRPLRPLRVHLPCEGRLWAACAATLSHRRAGALSPAVPEFYGCRGTTEAWQNKRHLLAFLELQLLSSLGR